MGGTLLSGFYLNELLLRLLPRHDPHRELFDQYADALGGLIQEASPALRVFEKRLLAALGYGLNLEREAPAGGPIETDAVYRYEAEQGPVRVGDADRAGICVRGATLLALAKEEFLTPGQLREARILLRDVLDRHLGERPLKTRTVMRALGKVRG